MNSFDTFLLITKMMQLPYTHHFLLDLHNYYYPTYIHSIHVASVAAQIGLRLNMTDPELSNLIAAGLLHDVGKLKVPRSILSKPGVLSDEEFHIIQKHPEDTFTMLDSYHLPVPDVIKYTGLMHHRYLDTSGYPTDALLDHVPISEETKMITVCDIFCALTSPRRYKQTYSTEFGIVELYRLADNNKVDRRYVQILDKILHSEGLLLNIGQYEELIISKPLQPLF